MTEEDALRAYAAMWNTFDVSRLEPLLADDFQFTSQMVIQEMDSKEEFLVYITEKLRMTKSSGSRVWAEMGRVSYAFPGPCVVVAQGGRDDLQCVVLAKVKNGKIHRLNLCIVPTPESAKRTGEYPA